MTAEGVVLWAEVQVPNVLKARNTPVNSDTAVAMSANEILLPDASFELAK
jgi:hypothetical protein